MRTLICCHTETLRTADTVVGEIPRKKKFCHFPTDFVCQQFSDMIGGTLVVLPINDYGLYSFCTPL